MSVRHRSDQPLTFQPWKQKVIFFFPPSPFTSYLVPSVLVWYLPALSASGWDSTPTSDSTGYNGVFEPHRNKEWRNKWDQCNVTEDTWVLWKPCAQSWVKDVESCTKPKYKQRNSKAALHHLPHSVFVLKRVNSLTETWKPTLCVWRWSKCPFGIIVTISKWPI